VRTLSCFIGTRTSTALNDSGVKFLIRTGNIPQLQTYCTQIAGRGSASSAEKPGACSPLSASLHPSILPNQLIAQAKPSNLFLAVICTSVYRPIHIDSESVAFKLPTGNPDIEITSSETEFRPAETPRMCLRRSDASNLRKLCGSASKSAKKKRCSYPRKASLWMPCRLARV
jgi:hypothetical protein